MTAGAAEHGMVAYPAVAGLGETAAAEKRLGPETRAEFTGGVLSSFERRTTGNS